MPNWNDALIAYMNEHYAHARDHEHLRAEITTILCASGFVLIGLADKDLARLSSIAVILLGLLNIGLIWLHDNRARAHISAAHGILQDLQNRLWHNPGDGETVDQVRARFDNIKRFEKRLTPAWSLVPALMIVVGLVQAEEAFGIRGWLGL